MTDLVLQGSHSSGSVGPIDRVLRISRPAMAREVAWRRRRRPNITPARLARSLEREFTVAAMISGGAVGAASAAPGVGTGLGAALAAVDIGGFGVMATRYVLGLCEVHGFVTEDLARQRTLVLGVLLGTAAQDSVAKVAGRTGPHWAKAIVKSVPAESLKPINKVLGRHFVTKYGTKQGIVVLGKLMPFGVGFVIGAVANLVFARVTVKTARRAFGAAPAAFPTAPPVDEPEVIAEPQAVADAQVIDAAVPNAGEPQAPGAPSPLNET